MMPPPRISQGWLRLFSTYSRFYLSRHFHDLRILKSGLPRVPEQPTIVYLNHASWWDPLVCLFLAQEFFRHRSSFAPMDAAMLKRYWYFRKLGFFGIEKDRLRGVRSFLGTSRALLASSQNVLWLTPQGRFADPRERPVQFRSGLGALAAHLRNVAFLPLAIEYPFWTDARPEILVSFGMPITPGHAPLRPTDDWTRLFGGLLELNQAQLAQRAIHRAPGDWISLNRARSGVALSSDVLSQQIPLGI